jgi:hypothetical protein
VLEGGCQMDGVGWLERPALGHCLAHQGACSTCVAEVELRQDDDRTGCPKRVYLGFGGWIRCLLPLLLGGEGDFDDTQSRSDDLALP